MATNPHIYVDSNHGTNDGSSDTSFASQQTGAMSSLPAAEVYESIGAAVAATTDPSDGDTIYIANDHDASYDNAGNILINNNGALDSTGLILISVDTTAIDEYLPGAVDDLSDNADDWLFKANGAAYGVTFSCGDNAINSGSIASYWTFTDVIVVMPDIAVTVNQYGSVIVLNNVEFNFSAPGGDCITIQRGCTLHWNGGKISGTAPTDFFASPPGIEGIDVIVTGVDLSPYTGTLFPTPASSSQDRSFVKFVNCQLNSSVTPVGTLLRGNHRFEMYGCDDSTSDKLFRFWIEDGLGSAKNNETVFVTATEAWYEGTDKSSIQVDTKANCSHTIPFVFELPAQYINLGDTSTDVLTIDLVTAETLVKHDLAAFLVYPDGTTSVIPRWVSSGPSVGTGNYGIDPLDTSTAMPTSALGAGDWTGEPGTPNFYELVLDTSGTPGQATAVSVRIEVYKASIGPIYIHPLITVSAT